MLDTIVNSLDKVVIDNLKMFFITRVLKPDYKKRDKVLEKYKFEAYHVDIDDEIRSTLFDYIKQQLSKTERKQLEIHEYDIVCDDTAQILTYQLQNKAMSFRSVVDTRLKGGVGIKKVQQIADLFNGQELWAYCVQFHFEDGTQVFTFTKISTGKVAIDPDPKTMVGKIQHPAKAVRAFFDTNSAKLELLKGESINLDKTIDCLLIGETFLVFSKTKFEWIVGLEEEFRIEACNVAEELCNCAFIEGANLIKDEIESNPSIHKRLAKLSKLGQHKNLDSDRVRAMLDYSKEIGVELKADNGKIKIENKQDIDLLAKFLADYYKDSKITGNVYGTYAGNLVRKGAFS